MAQRKTPLPLSAEQIVQSPYGDVKCRLCHLQPDQLQMLHKKKLEEKLSYKAIRDWIKEHFKIGVDFTEINLHFNRHVLGKHLLEQVLVKPKDFRPEVMRALEPISSGIKVVTSDDLEKAYEALVKMAQTFVGKTKLLQEKIAIKFTERDKSGMLAQELDAHSMMDLLEKQAKLNKESREFIKEVSALRAPKVMVAQFLEAFMDDILRELSRVFNDLCQELMFEVISELADSGHPGAIGKETFAKVFRKSALDYRDRMINLKRQKMADAMAALEDLEKII